MADHPGEDEEQPVMMRIFAEKPSAPGAHTTSITVEASRRASLPLSELWRYRELLYFLTWREIKVRYKQTALGAAWALLQPFALTILFAVVFGRFVRLPSSGLPYPLFFFAALVPWTVFANGVTSATNSLVANQTLVTRVFFPRLILPLASTLAGLIDFWLAAFFLIAMAVFYGFRSWTVLLLPLFLLLDLLVVFAVGVWFAALNARYRDVRQGLPVVLQLWLFASPVVYPSGIVPRSWQTIFSLNPMFGVIEGFRWSVTGVGTTSVRLLGASAGVAVALLATGLQYFRKTEGTIADIV